MKSFILALSLFIFSGGQIFAEINSSVRVPICDLQLSVKSVAEGSLVITIDQSKVDPGESSHCNTFSIYGLGSQDPIVTPGNGIRSKRITFSQESVGSVFIAVSNSFSKTIVRDIYLLRGNLVAIDPTNIY